MGSIDWADVLRGALAFFLVIVGIGIAYVCFRLGGMLGRMSVSVVRVTDEVVPILSRAQGTVDGINLELARVDEIMVSAVNATKGAEKTVTSLSHAVTAPVKKASGLAAAAKEAMATFRARRSAGSDEADDAYAADPGPPGTVDSVGDVVTTQDPSSEATGGVGSIFREAVANARAATDAAKDRLESAATAVRETAADAVDAAKDRLESATSAVRESTADGVDDARAAIARQASASANGSPSAPNARPGPHRGPSESQIAWARPRSRA